MNVLSERLFAENDAPRDVRVVPPATMGYALAIAELGERLEAGANFDSIMEALDRAAASAFSRVRIDAVLVPGPLDLAEPSDVVLHAFSVFAVLLEMKGLMIVDPGFGPRGRTWDVLDANQLVWRTMQTVDDRERAALWKECWELTSRMKAENGGHGHHAQRVARYVAGDSAARDVLKRTSPAIVEAMETAGARLSPVPWRREVLERARLPATL
jgi:hypothetical protein